MVGPVYSSAADCDHDGSCPSCVHYAHVGHHVAAAAAHSELSIVQDPSDLRVFDFG